MEHLQDKLDLLSRENTPIYSMLPRSTMEVESYQTFVKAINDYDIDKCGIEMKRDVEYSMVSKGTPMSLLDQAEIVKSITNKELKLFMVRHPEYHYFMTPKNIVEWLDMKPHERFEHKVLPNLIMKQANTHGVIAIDPKRVAIAYNKPMNIQQGELMMSAGITVNIEDNTTNPIIYFEELN